MANDNDDAGTSLRRQTILSALTLFASTGTLLCCALPALLVALGMGAALAGLVGAAPWITVLSDYKIAIFTAAGLLLAASALLHWRARNAPCPADPLQAKACARLRRAGVIILGVSACIYAIGFFFAFLAADFFY